MGYLWEFELGAEVFEASIYYDDGDSPIAREGPASYEPSQPAAETFACAALRGRHSSHPGGFWYATIRRGRVVDPIGDGLAYDREFEPDGDWSRTLLAEDDQ